ncbi:hypothetical protein CH63R_05855 [Colletotrichum higginsianum IMI 349063]|uniref:Uncharacterized protein n=1 Tax=Colletotrichum higginsianum (strain IMI 349063) TaxID=759273 RepID=A0A1B7YDJ8_COLHI|nr:hypothetical protein CH63R_05855 [Colletotrichum higginsianum IMI 349063]OBR10163.1 hypothetical protein CH63R_05855 [Colletotrichum higginsianum IMI 349063]
MSKLGVSKHHGLEDSPALPTDACLASHPSAGQHQSRSQKSEVQPQRALGTWTPTLQGFLLFLLPPFLQRGTYLTYLYAALAPGDVHLVPTRVKYSNPESNNCCKPPRPSSALQGLEHTIVELNSALELSCTTSPRPRPRLPSFTPSIPSNIEEKESQNKAIRPLSICPGAFEQGQPESVPSPASAANLGLRHPADPEDVNLTGRDDGMAISGGYYTLAIRHCPSSRLSSPTRVRVREHPDQKTLTWSCGA